MPRDLSSEGGEGAATTPAAAPEGGAAAAMNPAGFASPARVSTAAGNATLLPWLQGLSDSYRRGPSPLERLQRQQQRAAAAAAAAEAEEAAARGRRHYLTYSERQVLLNPPASPWLPVLLALGVFCIFSMSLSSHSTGESSKLIEDHTEAPFIPHESDIPPHFLDEQTDTDVNEDYEDRLLSVQTKDLFSLGEDNEDQHLDWFRDGSSISKLLQVPYYYKMMLDSAPASLLRQVDVLLDESRKIQQQRQQQQQQQRQQQRQRRRSKTALLLQEDLLAAAEMLTFYRAAVNAASKPPTEEQQQQLERLQQQLGAAVYRFKYEWGEVFGVNNEFSLSLKEQQLYSRLVDVTGGSLEDMLHALSEKLSAATEAATKTKTKTKHRRFKNKINDEDDKRRLSTRLELGRLLSHAGFPGQIGDAFEAD